MLYAIVTHNKNPMYYLFGPLFSHKVGQWILYLKPTSENHGIHKRSALKLNLLTLIYTHVSRGNTIKFQYFFFLKSQFVKCPRLTI